MISTDRAALIALYNETGGASWRNMDNWKTAADLSTWVGVEVNDQGRVVKLALSFNELTGSIPESLGSLAQLLELNLEGNKVAGPIPESLGSLAELEVLNLEANRLTGPIPESLGSLARLKVLNLSWNKITGRQQGPIPESLSFLTQLKVLNLEGNQLTGPIPRWLGSLAQLRVLNLKRNQLTGPIPEALGRLSKLEKLKIYDNRLTGLIPEALGELRELWKLDLLNNNLRGPVPEKLREHENFRNFQLGIALDGPSLPAVEDKKHAIKILVVPVVLGYADLASDLYTAVAYYNSDHPVWFGLGLAFALGPALITSVFFLSEVKWYRRVLVATHLSLLFEAYRTVDDHGLKGYSPVLALMRVVEPLFESVPQLLLQLYAMLTLWAETLFSPGRLVRRVASVCISAVSLAHAATDVSSVERLSEYIGGSNSVERFRLCPRLPSLTSYVFSRVPKEGSPCSMRGVGLVHPRSHVWICFVYHILEIVSRFVSLAMAMLVLRKWFFLVLPYLWMSRGLIVCAAAWQTADLEKLKAASRALDFRFRVRLVAMPFLDSIVDGTRAFGLALALTLVEFISCLTIYDMYEDDDLTASARRTLMLLASGCMVGKMFLAWVVIFPLKADEHVSGSSDGVSVRDGVGNAVAEESAAGSAYSSIMEGGTESAASKPVELEGPVRW